MATTLAVGYGGTAVTLVAGLLATPWLLRWLGPERFGALRVAQDYTGYVGLLELGTLAAVQQAVARAAAADDPARVRAVVRAGVRVLARCSGLMSIAMLGLAAAAPTLIPTVELAGELRWGLLMATAGTALLPLMVMRALADGSQQGYLTHAALMAQSLVILVASLTFAAAGFGLTGQFAAALLGGCVLVAALYVQLRPRFPGVLGWSGADPAVGRQLWQANWPMFAFNLLGRVGGLSDAILLALMVSTPAVTPFVLTLRLPSLAAAQVQSVGTAAWAGLAELYHRGEMAKMTVRLTQLTRLTSWLALAVLLPVCVLNRPFIRLWVGPDVDAGPLVSALGVTNGWLLCVLSVWAWVVAGTGRVGLLLPTYLIGTAANVVVSVVATRWLGAAGPLLGSTVFYLGVLGWRLPLILRLHYQVPAGPLARAALTPLALAIPCGAGLWVGWNLLTPVGNGWPAAFRWAALATAGAVAGVGYLALGWVVLFPAADRREWVARVWPSRRAGAG